MSREVHEESRRMSAQDHHGSRHPAARKLLAACIAVTLVAAILATAPAPVTAQGVDEPDLPAAKGDIVFVVDESGSMANDIADVRARIGDVMTQLDEEEIDFRIGVVGYSAGNRIYSPLSDDPAVIQAGVDMLAANRDNPEAGFSATVAAMSDGLGHRPDAATCQVTITDEDADVTPDYPQTKADALEALRSRDAVFFGATLDQGNSYFDYGPQPGSLAAETRGASFDLVAFRADAGPVLEALIADCISKIEMSQPLFVDAGEDQSVPEGSVVTLDGTASSSVQGIEDQGRFAVDARSNIFASGAGAVTNRGGVLPVEVDDLVPGTVVSFAGATGQTFANLACTSTPGGPDGAGTGNVNVSAQGGISGLNAVGARALVGVFVSDDVPAAPAPTPNLNFQAGREEFSSLRPAIGQTFRIGDGVSPSGVRHLFEVPTGATRLFLGFATTAYNNLCGSIEVDISTSTGPAPLTYSWELLEAYGPPVQLSGTSMQDPSFSVFDDGTYRLRLTVADGVETLADETTVTVTNEPPQISEVASDAAATDGLVEVTVTYTDPGPFDTHTVQVDWGDGSPIEDIPAQAGGTGWGFAYAGHRYATLGEHIATVTVVDDDGGVSAPQTVTVDVGGAGPGEPGPGGPIDVGAVFVAGTDSQAIRVSGSKNEIHGATHSNGGIRVSGSHHTFLGGTGHVGALQVSGAANVFDPAATQVAPAPLPAWYAWADYQPGGRAAVAAGDDYRPILPSQCSGGKWSPQQPLTSGLYVVPCGVHISGAQVAGQVTIVATGDIKVSGSGHIFEPFIDGLLFFSNATGSRAVDLSGSHHDFLGAMYTPAGGIEVTGSHNDLGCGIASQALRISGSHNTIAGVNCGIPGTGPGGEGTTVSIAAPPVLVPALTLELAGDRDVALPGDTITYDATLRNGLADTQQAGSASLLVPVLVGVDNLDTGPATVTGVTYRFEAHDPATDEWHTWASTDPAAPPGQQVVTLAGRPTPEPGVTYAAGGYAGTVVDPGALASWASAATISLSVDQLDALFDPARVDAVRSVVTIETDTPLVRKIARVSADPLAEIRIPPGADTTDGQIVATLPGTGPVTFDAATTPELGLLTPGDAVSVTGDATVPAPEPAAVGESDAAYVARLAALDEQAWFAAAYGRATAGVGGIWATQQLAGTQIDLPVLTATLATPGRIAAGAHIPVSFEITNVGSATATGIDVTVDADSVGTIALAGLPASLAPGESAIATASVATIPDTTVTHGFAGTVHWSQDGTEPVLYGPLRPTSTTIAAPPVALDAIKYDNDEVVADGISYVLAVTNTGTDALTGVTIHDPIDPNATIIAGSVSATSGTITAGEAAEDRAVTVDVGTLTPSQSVTVTLEVDYTLAPADTTQIVNQATITSDQLGDVVSDDPSEPGTADLNVTPITPPSATIPGVPDGPGGTDTGPTLDACDPADGDTITAPTPFTCVLIPRDGTTIEDWTVLVMPAGGTPAEATPIGTGTGPDVTGEIDPTLLPNGIWDIVIVADDDQDGRSVLRSAVIVDGQLKLGRSHLTFQDLSVPVGGIPIQVLRTYDTLERNRSGDFGHGSDLDVSNFQVRSNRPIGQGGWEQYECGVAVLVAVYCYESHTPHFVTVTWPDGRTETFDATPDRSPPAFTFLTPLRYTGRPGTTSTLRPAPGDEFAMLLNQGNDDSSFYKPLTAQLYNPTRFTLVARDGTRYLLDTATGLVQATDRNANTVTVTEDGIESSAGPGIDFERDAAGRITTVTGPDGEPITYDYSTEGDLEAVTDQNEHTTRFEYEDHALVRIVDPLGNPFQRLEYDDDGRLVAITDANDNRTPITVDVDARTQVMTSADGRQVTLTTFDERGNPVASDEIFDGASHVSSWTYSDDGRDLITTRTDPNDNTWSADYDDKGNLVAFADPNGHTTTVQHDDFGQPLRMVDHQGGYVEFGYDSRGNITTMRDPDGNVRSFTYNSHGMVTAASDTVHPATTFSYTPEGWLQSRTDGNGVTTTYEHDAAGRVIAENRPEGVVTHVYDGLGQRTELLDQTGRTTWEYDEVGQTRRIESPQGAIEYGYDDVGRRTSMVTPDATFSYDYDTVGRLVELTGPGGTFAMTYGHGGVETITRPNGVTTTQAYDPAGQLTDIIHEHDGQTLAEFHYTLDPSGNRTRLDQAVDGTSWTETYTLDELNRLLSVNYSDTGQTTAYTYSRAGSRTSMTVSGAGPGVDGTTTYTYDSAQQLVSYSGPGGSNSLSYDGNGNQVTDNTDAFVFNSRNRMTAASTASGAGSYAFNGDGLRVDVDGRNQLWDLASSTSLLVNDGSTTQTYAGAALLAQTDGSMTSFPLADGLGSTRVVTDGDGAVTGTARYDVYGASVASTGTESTFGYTGQQTDATGLLFLRNRMYEPRTGRFASADIVTANGFGTNGFSMYGYGEGAPSQNTDILGLGINLGGYIANVNSAKTRLNLVMSLAWNTYVAAQNCDNNWCVGAKVAVSGALTLALATTPHLAQMNRFMGALVGCPIGVLKDALVVGPGSNVVSGAGGILPTGPGAISACVRGAIVGAAFPPTG